MKRLLLGIVVSLGMVLSIAGLLSFSSGPVLAMTGSGTAGDPYIISDINDFQNISLNLAAYYELAGGINASATSGWNGGTGFTPLTNFSGNLDGKGSSISLIFINLTVPGVTTAVFTNIYSTGVVENLVLDSIYVMADPLDTESAAGFCEHNYGLVTNCSVYGNINAWWQYGFCDENYGNISDCVTYVGYASNVSGAVGFCGWNYGNITDCTAASPATVGGPLGGLTEVDGFSSGNMPGGTILRCGSAIDCDYPSYGSGFAYENGGTITESFATGNVTNMEWGSGFVNSNYGLINKCYATGEVSGLDNVFGGQAAGFCADNYDGATISNCYYTGNVSSTFSYGAPDDDITAAGFCLENIDGSSLVNCYSKGSVSSDHGSAGFCYDNYAGVITSCYFDNQLATELPSTYKVSRTGFSYGGVSSTLIEFWMYQDTYFPNNDYWNLKACKNIDCGIYQLGGNAYTVYYENGNKSEVDFYYVDSGGCTLLDYTESLFTYSSGNYTYQGLPLGWGIVAGSELPPVIMRIDGGTGKTTSEMKQRTTFTGWDFNNEGIWSIIVGSTYPWLGPMQTVVPYAPPSGVVGGLVGPDIIGPPPNSSSWWGGTGNLSNLPMYVLFTAASTSMGMNVRLLYLMAVIITVVVMGVGCMMATGSLLLGFALTTVMMFAAVAAGVIGVWVVILYIILVLSYMLAARGM
jgi:hypothetical protein